MKKIQIGIIMGSDSDLPIMEETTKILEQLGIGYEINIASAHRSPKKVIEYTSSASKRGIEVIIAGAGGAAHLAGVIAAHTSLPVIGVPLDSSPLGGLDSLLSTVQMPSGVPVATMALGKTGAKNAAVFSAQILAIKYPKIKKGLERYKKNLSLEIENKDKNLKEKTNR